MIRSRCFTLLPFLIGLGCTRLGNLGEGVRGVLADDARFIARDDPSGPGEDGVIAVGTTIGDWDDGFPVVVYRPANQRGTLPGVIFLPARSAPEFLYESYGRALASHGFAVVMRGWYSHFRTDPELADDARRIATWMVAKGWAQPQRLGLAGHSMGGKSSILAALDDPRFSAVVAIDPDENGRTWVARGPIAKLRAPLLVIGMEVAYKALRMCATPDGNFRSFFTHAPAGTLELMLKDADHVQPMDKPDMIGMGICRVGHADSRQVRSVTRGAMIRFFEHHLRGLPMEIAQATGTVLRKKPGR